MRLDVTMHTRSLPNGVQNEMTVVLPKKTTKPSAATITKKEAKDMARLKPQSSQKKVYSRNDFWM